MLVDAKYLKVKGYEREIPVIYGVDYYTHDIPHYLFSIAENYASYDEFFRDLLLLKYPLQNIVSDDNSSIRDACTRIYPRAVAQLCLNHYKESLRRTLQSRKNEYYGKFIQEIEQLFTKKRSRQEFDTHATRIFLRYQQDPVLKTLLIEMDRRKELLNGHWFNKEIPQTNNLIECLNSHLEGRLKTIKGFESFEHADHWLNAYFLRRRTKPFTDCTKKFKDLNGKCALEVTLMSHKTLPQIF
jgi:transposase-like protein